MNSPFINDGYSEVVPIKQFSYREPRVSGAQTMPSNYITSRLHLDIHEQQPSQKVSNINIYCDNILHNLQSWLTEHSVTTLM